MIAPIQKLCSLTDGEKQSDNERINLDIKYLRSERKAKTLSEGKYTAPNVLLILVDGKIPVSCSAHLKKPTKAVHSKQLAINNNMNTDYFLQVINLHRKTLRENKV